MSKDASKSRMIKNEQLLREKNTAASKGIKKYLHNDPEVLNEPIAFVCECSRIDCNEHVSVSIKDYESLHERKDRFLVAAGHESPSVEKVVRQQGDFDVVEKFALSSK